jgi:hypothetical protein
MTPDDVISSTVASRYWGVLLLSSELYVRSVTAPVLSFMTEV